MRDDDDVGLKYMPSDVRVQELCESRSGRPGLPVPNKPAVSVDVKQQITVVSQSSGDRELCESRGGCPRPPCP